MTPEQVLDMPARRFWSMEGNMARIRAEQGLRLANVAKTVQNPDQYGETVESLSRELGEVHHIKRPTMVKGDPNAKAKFKALS